MASIIALLSVVLICIGAGQASKEFVNVQCQTETTGQIGQQSLLNCVIKTSQEVTDPEIILVLWKKKGVEEPVLIYRQKKLTSSEKYRFADLSWNEKNMNVSLLITNTAVDDEGEYTCTVVTDSGDNTSKTTLKVTAKYKIPNVSSIKKTRQGEDDALVCRSYGGYPEGELRWFDEHNTDWTKSAEMRAEKKNGLFELSSQLILMRGSTFSNYTCVVFNASGGKEGEATFEIQNKIILEQKGNDALVNPSKWVAPVVVIGSLIIGLLLLLFIRRRSQKARRQSTAPLMGDHQEVPTHDVEKVPPAESA